MKKIKAKIEGYFKGTATVTIDKNGKIDEVIEVIEVDDTDDCEIITEIV